MTKLKKYLFVILIALLSVTPAISGCGLSSLLLSCTSSITYDLTFYENSLSFSWRSVDNATGYYIYLNDEVVDAVSADDCIYSFGHLINDVGNYEFKVEAIKTGMSFTTRPVIQSGTYVKTIASIVRSEYETITIDSDSYIDDIYLSSGVLYFSGESGVNYALGIYSNTLGYHVESIAPTINASGEYCIGLSAQNYLPSNEISAIRLLEMRGAENYIVSDILYYNPDNYKGFTDKIYLFDGLIYDYYINTLDELQNIIYHSFVYRETDFNIKLSEEVYSMAKRFDGGNFAECLDLLIYQYGFGSFCETSAYIANNIVNNETYFSKPISAKEKTYNIKISYLDIDECDETVEPNVAYLKKQESSSGYYEKVDYEMLDSKYEIDTYKFASDNRFLYTEVSTTEQLYWAVENKITPLPVSGSRAERIYNKAKETVMSIVSEEMTDFEKVLSIFDWICINTVYDHTPYAKNIYPTRCSCYYLEGIFDRGVAVCDGFSKAFSLMCNMVDIDATRVTGNAITNGETGGHAWNKVLIDKDPSDDIPEQYYFVDITWTEIYSDNTNEILSHRYFLMGDNDVKDTHFEHSSRQKYKKYIANSNFGYYNYMTFESGSKTYDYALDSDGDAEALFDYMLKNAVINMEVVFDIDFMIDKYEEINNTAYIPQSDVSVATTIGGEKYYIYYLGLKSFFINDYLKQTKFNEQYLFLVSSLDEIVYNSNGSKGFVYVITQNFLIDESEEVSHLVSALNQNTICGTFDLYVENSIIKASAGITQSSLVSAVEKLFKTSLSGANNINVSFTFVQANYNVGTGTDTKYACHYKMTITRK